MTSMTTDIPVRHRATAIIKNGDKFLLFHRIKPGHDYFMFPGGGVDDNETVEEALKREIKEELNISVGNFRKIFPVDNIYAPAWATAHPGQKQIYHFFEIDDYTGVPELGGPEKDQANDQNQYILTWLSFNEIRQMKNIVPSEGLAMFLKYYEKIEKIKIPMIHEGTFKSIDFNGSKGLVFLGDKILVYRRDNKTTNSPLCIDLPGGGRENDESPFETFRREVKEEFGITIEKDDIQFSSMHQSVIEPTKNSFLIVTKPLNFKESDIIFGNEGVEWLLMTPAEFIARPDGIKRQQDRVVKYLNT